MNHLKWSLIILGVIAISSFTIWSVWTFVARKNKKELEELSSVVQKASADKLKKFAEEQGEEATGDVFLMSKVTTSVLPTIEITEDDVKNSIEFLIKNFESEDDKKKIREIDIGKVRTVANDKVTKIVVKAAKEIVKKLTMKAVKEEIDKVCYEVEKSVSGNNEKKFEISGKAAQVLEKVFGIKEFGAVKGKIESEAKAELIGDKDNIKNDILRKAISEMAEETFVE